VRVAIVHYWWLSNRGGEAVIAALAELFPHADLFLHVVDRELVSSTLGAGFAGAVNTSFIAKLPGARRYYQNYVPMMPLALEQFDLTSYDLVISSESGPAKGVITAPHSLHVCYCHSPMRYAWDMYHEYRNRTSAWKRCIMVPLMHYMRAWDQLSAQRVDQFIANSAYVAGRIRKFYRRDARVIHPPVDVEKFQFERNDGPYLSVGQLVSYKRADLLVEAFNENGLPLVIIGEGELFRQLRRRARGNITLLGRQPFSVIREYYANCRALVFPGTEDFGIVPVEAMAAGKPVVAFAKGGALETVLPGRTGVLFREQTAVSLNEAIASLESNRFSFDPQVIAAHAANFSRHRFLSEFKTALEEWGVVAPH
jgi:glycosyltransferase involved in cell wall biosynthesis